MKALSSLWGVSLNNYAIVLNNYAIADDPSTSPDVLDVLSHDTDPNIRCYVAENPSSSPETLVYLSRDTSIWVITNAVRNPSFPYGVWLYKRVRMFP